MITIEMLKPLLQLTGGLIAIILLAFLLKKSKKTTKKLSVPPKNNCWSLNLLMSLEWKRYEEVCKEFLIIKEKGRVNVNLTKMGADAAGKTSTEHENNKKYAFFKP